MKSPLASSGCLRWFFGGTLCLALGLALTRGWWLDLPRHLVEAELARRLEAEVELQRLEIISRELFRLHGLTVRSPYSWPEVREFTLEEVEIEASLREIRALDLRRVQMRNLVAQLQPAPPVVGPPVPSPKVDLLTLEGGKILLQSEDHGDGGEVIVAAEVQGFGTHPVIQAQVRSNRLHLPPWVQLLRFSSPEPWAASVTDLQLDFQGSLEEGEMEFRTGPGLLAARGIEARFPTLAAGLQLEVAPQGKETRGQGRLALSSLDIDGFDTPWQIQEPALNFEVQPRHMETGAQAPYDVVVHPQLPGLHKARIQMRFLPGQALWQELEARVGSIRWSEFWPPLGLDGQSTVHLQDDGEHIDLAIRTVAQSLRTADGTIEFPGATFDLEVRTDHPADLEALPTSVEIRDLRAGIPSVRGRLGDQDFPEGLFPFQSSFEGDLHLQETRFQGQGWLQTPQGRLELLGSATASELTFESNDPPTLDLQWTLPNTALEAWADLLRSSGQWPEDLPRTLDPRGTIRGQGRLWGPLPHPRLEARMKLVEVRPASEAPFTVQDASFRITTPALPKGPLRLDHLTVRGQLAARLVPPESTAFELTSSGMHLDVLGLRLGSTQIHLEDLARLQIEGTWQKAGEAQLQIRDLDLAHWQERLTPDLGFAASGQAELDLVANVTPGGRWHLQGPLRLRNVGLLSDDETRAMEALSGDFDFRATGHGTTPQEGSLEGRAGGFLALWGTLFGDFSDFLADLDLSLKTVANEGARLDFRLGAPQIFDLEGTLDHREGDPLDVLDFALNLRSDDLSSLGPGFVARFDGGRPLDLEGQLRLQLEGHHGGTPKDLGSQPTENGRLPEGRIQGSLSIQDLHYQGNQTWVAGLDLDLPILLEATAGRLAGDRQPGRIQFDALQLRDLEIPAVESALWVEADSLGLVDALTLPVFGGQVVLESPTASHLLGERRVRTGLRLEDLDLEKISADLGLFPLEGTLTGDFPTMVLRDNDVEIEGGGTIRLFDGTVTVRDIAMRDAFSPFPELLLSADFQDLNLGRLTRRIDFGEMEGILAGTIQDCRLFRGVPVTCRARFESQKRRGIDRTVDIKAVNNLTILGTGQRATVLDRGVQRFLKRFTYAALGVEIQLAKDVLRLRGLEYRGERELFLRGRLPFPIDIVNAQPGGAVSFQAMLRRLGSLDFDRVRTSQPDSP